MYVPVVALPWHLARAEGRRGWHGHALAALAAAASALVLLVLLAVYLGAGARVDHTAWRTPTSDPRGGAIQVLSTTFVRATPVTVVELAQLPGRPATPAPPGLTAFPAPGEVYLSPALARRVRALPANQLADRFPRPGSYRTIGPAGLASPDELVAVVGREPTDPAIQGGAEADPSDGLSARAVVSGFARTTRTPGVFLASDRALAVIGAGMLVVPVLMLAAASGRLGAARREQRLARLRLAGATPGQILAMTGLEAAVVGAAGALAGAAAFGLLLPVLARAPYGIGSWYPGQLWVGLGWLAAVIAAVAVVTAVSAISALRQVALAPLGVAAQADPRRTRIARLGLFLAVIGYVAVRAHSGGLGVSGLVGLMVLFYGGYWTLGPWVVDQLGRLAGRLARRPSTLLAGRRLSDDPRGAWRTVSGLVLAGFVAGFCTVGHLAALDDQYPGQVAVASPAAGSALAARAQARLRAAGVTATIRIDPTDSLLWGDGLVADVTGGPAAVDAVRTALTGLVPGTVPVTQENRNADIDAAMRQLGQLGLAALVLSFLLAATSAGLTAAATVLDRRRVYRLLRLAGTPLAVLDRARVWETALPLIVLAGGTTAAGVAAAVKVNALLGGGTHAIASWRLAGCVLLGAAAMFGAIGASRPLLRAVTADPIRSDD